MRDLNSAADNAIVSRVFMCSPHQGEVDLRRNRSKIFVSIAGEGMIDSILGQGYRPLDNFIPAIKRAIVEAGLKDGGTDGDIILRPAFDHNATAGFNQQHLVSSGWIQNNESEVYDLVVELELQGEELPNVEMKTYNGQSIEGYEFENPLCIAVDIEDLYPRGADEEEMVDDTTTTETETQTQSDTQTSEASQEQSNGSGRGAVKNPETDGRLKQNRQNAMARRSQDRDDSGDNQGRMAGKPGRVRDPRFDFRLKHNRGSASAEAGR